MLTTDAQDAIPRALDDPPQGFAELRLAPLRDHQARLHESDMYARRSSRRRNDRHAVVTGRLAVVVADDEFVAMVSAANSFRDQVGAIGVGGADIDDYVRGRLYWNPKLPALPEGHQALANEIVVVLGDSRLSSTQMAELERAYFPPRGRR